MAVLALDVDGVILDPDRAGDGHWTNDLERRLGISRAALRSAFFMRTWDDVVNGRVAIEPALQAALDSIGTTASLDDVLACWFDADFVVIEATVQLATRASASGHRVVLATNQERRRAAYLRHRLGDLFPIDDLCYSADLGVQKHDDRFFEMATARLAAAPDEIVFVDDAEINVDTARRAGWTAVHAAPGVDWHAQVDELLIVR